MSDKKLKAYEVREDSEGYCTITFETNGAAARREGASELGTDWECIESCVRRPEFDQYAPGPVPPMTLLEHGWWFECSHCGQRVGEDSEDEEGDVLDPRPAGKSGIFCSASCECADHMEKRGREEAADALREVFEAKFPGAEILDVHVYGGPKLEAGCQGRYVVTFKFPGSTYSASWEFGDEFVNVPQIDVDAFNAWRKGGV